jgi:hypothetical protein
MAAVTSRDGNHASTNRHVIGSDDADLELRLSPFKLRGMKFSSRWRESVAGTPVARTTPVASILMTTGSNAVSEHVIFDEPCRDRRWWRWVWCLLFSPAGSRRVYVGASGDRCSSDTAPNIATALFDR